MPTYEVDWEFCNAFLLHHGETGKITVEAGNRSEAEEKAQREVSRKLFNTTFFRPYVQTGVARKKS